ncbi:unnamed protein product, partial [marine sediment metagenome]
FNKSIVNIISYLLIGEWLIGELNTHYSPVTTHAVFWQNQLD